MISKEQKAKKKHQKHAKLVKPTLGEFGRNEWAILGTTCGNIQRLAYALCEKLSPKYKFAYVDAEHKKAADIASEEITKNALNSGSNFVYTDKISHHQLEQKGELNTYKYRTYFNEQDVIIVNGNHFKAKKQIVVIDEKKAASLKKRQERLTNVALILLVENAEIPNYIKEDIVNFKEIPIYSFNDFEKVSAFLQEKMSQTLPPLYGLVLAGGKSERMGEDKGVLNYHGKAQREYVADLLNDFCENIFLSCRVNQVGKITTNYPLISDSFLNLGPYGAILSAFKENPNAAFLVVACDLPLLDKKTIKQLVTNRNPSAIATAFHNTITNFPEPLITIWEPKSYLTLFQYLVQGYSCPRKVLINEAVHLLHLENQKVLTNVNNQEEYKLIKKELS